MDNQDGMHPDDKRNLIIFLVAAFALWYVFDSFVMQPQVEKMEAARQQQQAVTKQAQTTAQAGRADANLPDAEMPVTAARTDITKPRPRADVLAEGPRLTFENKDISGSLSLKGGRIDDLSLKNYFKTLKKKERVVLLSPSGTAYPKYVETGWLAGGNGHTALPDKNTVWSVEGNRTLTPDSPVTLVWNNGQGLTFRRTLSLDEEYLFTISQSVTNSGAQTAVLFPYALATQHGVHPDEKSNRLAHTGPIAYLDGELVERDYGKMEDEPEKEIKAKNGWIGLSDLYWFTSLIPAQDTPTTFRFLYSGPQDEDEAGQRKYQVDMVGQGYNIPPGQTVSHDIHVFSGAKEISALQKYEEAIPVHHFDLAVDFGILYFLTKPIFYLLNFLGGLVGNFGIAIIILTIMIRAAVFPLANTSFRSFAKLKQVAPQMKELREKHSDDKQKLQQELVKLYEREKVNPMAGCLPIVMQIPIFFALYKVLWVTIEMRHEPFFGWIKDLSQPDPTTVFNLFGLIPWDPPSFLMIGGWPCIMLAAMLVQRRLHPPPQDPIQQGVQDMMPFVMTFILSRFAAGLVIYWTFSNIFSVIQQYIIMTRMGVEVHLFKRSKDDKEMEDMVKKGPKVHPELEVAEDEIEDALFGHHEDEDGHTEGEGSGSDGEEDDEPEISPPTKKKKSKKRNK